MTVDHDFEQLLPPSKLCGMTVRHPMYFIINNVRYEIYESYSRRMFFSGKLQFENFAGWYYVWCILCPRGT